VLLDVDVEGDLVSQEAEHFLRGTERHFPTMLTADVQPQKLAQGMVCHIACSVGYAVQGAVMRHHHLPIPGHAHIKLNFISVQRQCSREGRQRIFRHQSRNAPMGTKQFTHSESSFQPKAGSSRENCLPVCNT